MLYLSPRFFLTCLGSLSREPRILVPARSCVWWSSKVGDGCHAVAVAQSSSSSLSEQSWRWCLPSPLISSTNFRVTPFHQSSPSSRMSPAVLFIIVVLAVLLFISGLLHFILRCFIRKRHPRPSSSRSAPELSGSDALQRQLQQLFHLHDSGVDQALIDALPVFLYKDVVGSKEPLECAVCLCEFDGEDELRLLPVCGHAFHLSCIDTWLLSNSTCPLCRGSLFLQGMAVEDPVFFYLGDSTDEGEASPAERAAAVAADEGDEIAADRRRVFHVRLGKFRNLGNGNVGGDCNEDNSIAIGSVRREEGETSSSSLTARRCFSMGSYQYVVADAQLQVALKGCSALRIGDGRGIRGTDARGNSPGNEAVEGERLSIGSRHESFSVSKVWLWSNKKGKVSMSSDTSALDTNSPWKTRKSFLLMVDEQKILVGSDNVQHLWFLWCSILGRTCRQIIDPDCRLWRMSATNC
ncbi:RING-H2 finger protein ATL47-like isoform X2 [Musa acuminata AAA Group]|uniref:RING-H2 finger protein ATL47-like isoform X2 n=1 Tax=Musa acuminata AAA Group TaxID=214697 RepID=UPI0031D2A2A4